VAFKTFATSTRTRHRPSISGVVEFSDDAFERYKMTLNDTAVWVPMPMPYGDLADVPPPVSAAFTWKALPYPMRFNALRPAWEPTNIPQIHSVKNGRYLCFGFFAAPEPASAPDQPYRAVDCGKIAKNTDTLAAILFGVINFKTSQLHATLF
jgi:hypothetical protein